LNRDNSFDVVRTLAALTVLFGHSFALLGKPEPWVQALDMNISVLAVTVFFALSGFLVTQSWQRDASVWRFAARRSLRIFPGLFVAVVFTALVVGTYATSVPRQTYLKDSAVWAFILDNTLTICNIKSLPGVFEAMPNTGPNGSLWTLRYEVLMYVLLVCAGLTGRMRSIALLFFFTFAFSSAYFQWFAVKSWASPVPVLWRIGLDFDLVRLARLGALFFGAVVVCAFWVPISRLFETQKWFGWCLALTGVCLAAMPPAVATTLAAFIVIPLATVYAATVRPGRVGRLLALGKNDLSFGIYIYSFPIQQSVSEQALLRGWSWLFTLATSLVLVLAAATLSWRYIEKPALAMKPSNKPSGALTRV
jgi:peptidoglycan/LPS O-acetylase OafA/YrhL